MQTTTLDFPRNARRVYTAVKNVFQTKTRFGNIDWDDVHFTVEARRGWFVSPFTESVKVKVVATGTEQSRVTNSFGELKFPLSQTALRFRAVITFCPKPPQLRREQAERDRTFRLHPERGVETGPGLIK